MLSVRCAVPCAVPLCHLAEAWTTLGGAGSAHVTADFGYCSGTNASFLGASRGHAKEKIVVALGLVLLIINLILGGPALLTTLGIILIVVGVVVNFVPIGGSSRRVW